MRWKFGFLKPTSTPSLLQFEYENSPIDNINEKKKDCMKTKFSGRDVNACSPPQAEESR